MATRRDHQYGAVAVMILATHLAQAQLSSVPDLATATDTASTSETSAAASSTSDDSSSPSSTESSSDATTSASTTGSTTASFVATATGSSASINQPISNVPTIAGAGIPTIGVPYTAGAAFMQKSDMPEGTVFIIIGAILAFLGACVLLWRGMVAWSINRSVKRAALASVRVGGGSEKNNSGWGSTNKSGYNPVKGAAAPPYRESAWAGSSMSLDALTSTGKPIKPFKDNDHGRSSPPPNLFFSPTAETRQSMVGSGPSAQHLPSSRSSTYLPAGYYASPSAQVAGGEGRTTVGGSLAPYARSSMYNNSPPASPGLPPSSRVSTAGQHISRDGLRPPGSHDSGPPSARNSYVDRQSYSNRNSHIDYSGQQRGSSYLDRSPRPSVSDFHLGAPSSSSLAINLPGSHLSTASESNLGGSRAPSAYLEDLMENHGNGPRERF